VPPRHWEGGPVGVGQPQHPPRIVLDSPRVYEFGGVFPEVTYPLHYDDSYWYQGLRIKIDLRRMASLMLSNLRWILELLAMQAGGFLLGWGSCILLYKDKPRILSNLVQTWPAWSAGMAGICLYSMVHIETRYIGAYEVVLLLTAYAVVQAPGGRLATGIVVAALVWAVIGSASLTQEARLHLTRSTSANVSLQTARGFRKLGLHAPNDWWQVATDLQKLGLRANDKVASVSWSNRSNVLWARLARVHIVAETALDVDFWRLSEDDQRRTLAAMASAGASMAVSDETPPDPARAGGWRQAGTTNYYAYSLKELVEPAQSPAISVETGWDQRH